MGPLLHCVASLGHPVSLSVLAGVSGGNIHSNTRVSFCIVHTSIQEGINRTNRVCGKSTCVFGSL